MVEEAVEDILKLIQKTTTQKPTENQLLADIAEGR